MTYQNEEIDVFQVDAFTDEPFKGNPAAVCIIYKEYPDIVLQKIAAEMNLSETAFIYVPEIDQIRTTDTFRLRWFTPQVEVNLCGHATLASSAVLFYELDIEADKVFFNTRSGELSAKRLDDGIGLNFPINEPEDVPISQELLDALEIDECINMTYAPEVTDILVEVKDAETVSKIKPDFTKLLKLNLDIDIRGVMVTAKGYNDIDFVSRFFAPWVGINEDPVTGSAHTILAPYWSKKLDKLEMNAYQMSERGGVLKLKLINNNRVEIIGKTALVLKGKLFL
jgi:PhzF family phenazine biosynthesis protein